MKHIEAQSLFSNVLKLLCNVKSTLYWDIQYIVYLSLINRKTNKEEVKKKDEAKEKTASQPNYRHYHAKKY